MKNLETLIQELCPDGVEFVKLGDVCKISRGKVYSKKYLAEHIGEYPVYSSQTANDGILGRIGTYDCDGKFLTWTTDGAYAGTIFYRQGKFSITNVCGLISLKVNFINLKFLYYWLSIEAPKHVYYGMGNPKLMSNQMTSIMIPVPPIEVQEEIVRILDSFSDYAAELQAELQARKQQYEYYRNLLLTFNPSAYGCGTDDEQKDGVTTWEGHNYKIQWKKLGEIGNICMCKRILKHQTNTKSGIPFYKIGTFGKVADSYISEDLFMEYKKKYSFPQKGEILISASGTIGRAVIYDGEDAYFQDSNIVWINNDESMVLNKYLYYFYQIVDWNVEGGTIKRLYNTNLSNTPIPLPPLELQEKIVAILDRFETLVNDLTNGLPAEIAAVKDQYEYYRNKLLTFKKLSA